MQSHPASATLLVAYLCVGSINADVDALNTPMIGAQAQYHLGALSHWRISLGSTVPTPGQPLLFQPDENEDNPVSGLTNGRYLPLSGVSWSGPRGLSPLLLGVPIETGSTVFHAGGGESRLAPRLGWILGGLALTAGALSAGGGGGSGGGSAIPQNSSSNGTRIDNPAPSPTGCQAYEPKAFAGDASVSQCVP